MFISWRLFGTDPSPINFVLYNDSTKITSVPLIDRTNFVNNTTINDIYAINVVLDGVGQVYSESAIVAAPRGLGLAQPPRKFFKEFYRESIIFYGKIATSRFLSCRDFSPIFD